MKLVIDDAEYLSIDELCDGIATAHRHDRAVAIHRVTRASLALAIAAWDVAGAAPGDRVEHGSVVPPDLQVAPGPPPAGRRDPARTRGGAGDDYRREVDDDDVRTSTRAGPSSTPGSRSWAAPTRPTRPIRGPRSPPRSGAGRRPVRCSARTSSSRAVPSSSSATIRSVQARAGRSCGAAADLCLLAALLDAALSALPDVEVAPRSCGGRVVWSS